MRKSIIQLANDKVQENSTHGTLREAFFFDVSGPASSEDHSLAAARVTPLNSAPYLLIAGHFIVAILALVDHPADALWLSFGNPLLWLAAVLPLDVAFLYAIRNRANLGLTPAWIFRGLCGFVLLSGLACIAFGLSIANAGHTGHGMSLLVAVCGGILVNAFVSLRSPVPTLCNAVVVLSASLAFASSLIDFAWVTALFLALLAYSLAETRSLLKDGRKRLALEAEARKAAAFVDDFEQLEGGWFWETDSEGTLSYVSRQLCDHFECEPEELLGKRFTNLLSVQEDPGSLEQGKTLGFHLSTHFPFSDVVVRAAGEKEIVWSLSGNPNFDELGHFTGFRGIGTDLTEQRRAEQEISRLARFDSLTGLPNRSMMRQTLDAALRNATHRQRGCGLFLVDLDRFKNVNDTLGHPTGDALLRQVAERLKTVMSDDGQIGRLGGDEFMAVLPGTVELSVLEQKAKRLIERVSQPYNIDGHRILIGASVGIAIGDPGRCSADSLVRDADLALYVAKGDGRGKCRVFESSMHSEASDRQVIENDLRQAIERDELRVVYQPIVRAAGEDVSGFEALVRWTHPTHGDVSPEKFIPIAEECGIITDIGRFVLETATSEAAHWPDNVRIAVNLSPIQFNDPAISQTIAHALKQSGIRGDQLELEITEGVFLAESEDTDATFAKLKSLGVRLALDDFGTGYSSLGYLKNAPFDKIKIDQSFVRGASSATSRNSAIIRAIVALAETLDLDTCAEGVETHDDLNLIRELGCSQIQGYIFGKPVGAEEARSLAKARSIEADGYKCIREPRQRLMRRGLAFIGDEKVEIRLRNISAMGALIECANPVSPGERLTIDIIGVGPVTGTVRWAQSGNFGMQFEHEFDLGRLAPKKQESKAASPWYVQSQKIG